jgi:hypothetical protein
MKLLTEALKLLVSENFMAQSTVGPLTHQKKEKNEEEESWRQRK